MVTKHAYLYVHENDGQPSAYSAEQTAINEALYSAHNAGTYNWDGITIHKLICDNPEKHRHVGCRHFLVTISAST